LLNSNVQEAVKLPERQGRRRFEDGAVLYGTARNQIVENAVFQEKSTVSFNIYSYCFLDSQPIYSYLTLLLKFNKEEEMSKKVLKVLADCRAEELTALSQYINHHYETNKDGYGRLKKLFKDLSIVEMKHAEILAERIYDLGGTPGTKPLKPPFTGGDIKQKFIKNIALEKEAITMLNKGIATCVKEGDNMTADLLKGILADEEEHFLALDLELDKLNRFKDNYLLMESTRD